MSSAIVDNFSQLLQRRLYEVLDANSRAVAAQLRRMQPNWGRVPDYGRVPVYRMKKFLPMPHKCLPREQTRGRSQESDADKPSVEPSWIVKQSSFSLQSIDLVPSTLESLPKDQN